MQILKAPERVSFTQYEYFGNCVVNQNPNIQITYGDTNSD